MPLKVKPEAVQTLKLPDFKLSDHWRLEQWAKDMNQGKTEAGTKILSEFLRKNVKLELAE